jgi:5-methylcytosine-specific restriction endonuclease McrA
MSRRRATRRRRYAAYLASAAWQARRRRWLRDQRRRGIDPVCVVCGTPWTLDDDLHHTVYTNLGQERDADLLPMDRGCHEALHRILDTSRAWRSMPRPAATAGIIAMLRGSAR